MAQEKNNQQKEKKKSNKILIIIIILLLSLMAGGSYFVYTTYINVENETEEKEDENIATGGEVIKDYEFDANGNPVPIKAPNIGMAIKSAVLGTKEGKAEMAIKNSGDIAIAPKIVFNEKTIYQAPLLEPGEAVLAKLEFGELTVGEHLFNVLAMYEGGSGLSLKSKVVVFEEGTEIKIIEEGTQK